METSDADRRLGAPIACKLKLLLCFLVLFGSVGLPTIGGTTTTTKKPRYVPCKPQDTGEDRARGNLLEETYASDNGLKDVIFILDRSDSIKSETFDKMKKFISSLIQYQVSTGAIIVHPEHTRIALFSFGKRIVVETDGVTGLLYDACVFEDKLASVPHDNSSQTRPTEALERAATVFGQSERRGTGKQILWFFSDGDFDNENSDEERAARKQVITQLREMGVKTFSVGVGRPNEGWLNSADREENLQSIAFEKSYYVCVEEWLEIMGNKLNRVETQAENRVPIYGLPISTQMAECAECIEQQKCACEVTETTYTCYDCSENNRNHPQYEYVCNVVVESPTEDPPKETDWLLYAYIGAAAFALILLLIIIIACCCCRSGCCCNRPRKSRPGPPVPPPPLPPRRRKQSTDDIDLDIYANTMQHVNGGFLPPNQPDADMYVEPVESPRDPQQTSIPNRPDHVGPAGQLGPRRALMPPKQAVDQKRTHSYEDVNNVAVNEKNMESWPEHLASLKEDGGLEHLGIISVRSDHYAFTSGFLLPSREVKELDSVFRQGQRYQSSHIKVAGNRYTIDKSELSQLNLHGTRPKIQPGSATTESVRIAKANDYFIIGVSTLENDLKCNSCVTELYHHFANHDEQNSV